MKIESKTNPSPSHFTQTFFLLGEEDERYKVSFITNQNGIEEDSISVLIKMDGEDIELLNNPREIMDFLHSLRFDKEGQLIEENYGPMTHKLDLYLQYLIKNENKQPSIDRPSISSGADRRREVLAQAREIASNAGRKIAFNDARDATHKIAWNANWDTACAAQAIVVMDLISEEQFRILTEPVETALEAIGVLF